jgi:hypothetical protein
VAPACEQASSVRSQVEFGSAACSSPVRHLQSPERRGTISNSILQSKLRSPNGLGALLDRSIGSSARPKSLCAALCVKCFVFYHPGSVIVRSDCLGHFSLSIVKCSHPVRTHRGQFSEHRVRGLQHSMPGITPQAQTMVYTNPWRVLGQLSSSSKGASRRSNDLALS